MHSKILTAPTTSAVLKGVRNKALPSVLIDEISEWLFGIFPEGVLVAAFICALVAIVAFVHGKAAVGRKLIAPVCDLGASVLPTTLNLSLLFPLVGLARTSFAMLTATGRANVDIPDELKRMGIVRRHEKQMADWRGWSFYGWQLTNYLKDKDHARLNNEPK